MDIEVVPLPAEKKKAKTTDESQLGFGRHFTDRMLLELQKLVAITADK